MHVWSPQVRWFFHAHSVYTISMQQGVFLHSHSEGTWRSVWALSSYLVSICLLGMERQNCKGHSVLYQGSVAQLHISSLVFKPLDCNCNVHDTFERRFDLHGLAPSATRSILSVLRLIPLCSFWAIRPQCMSLDFTMARVAVQEKQEWKIHDFKGFLHYNVFIHPLLLKAGMRKGHLEVKMGMERLKYVS